MVGLLATSLFLQILLTLTSTSILEVHPGKYFSKMASDGGLKVDNPNESIDSLSKEVENLKTRLEEERKKLNDVARKSLY